MGNAKLIWAIALFVLTIGAGYWLSLAGKPLNQLILAAHKLIALAAVVLAVLAFLQWRQAASLAPVKLLLLILIAVVIVTLFATGALLSQNKPLPAILLRLHQAATLVALLSAAGVLWL